MLRDSVGHNSECAEHGESAQRQSRPERFVNLLKIRLFVYIKRKLTSASLRLQRNQRSSRRPAEELGLVGVKVCFPELSASREHKLKSRSHAATSRHRQPRTLRRAASNGIRQTSLQRQHPIRSDCIICVSDCIPAIHFVGLASRLLSSVHPHPRRRTITQQRQLRALAASSTKTKQLTAGANSLAS